MAESEKQEEKAEFSEENENEDENKKDNVMMSSNQDFLQELNLVLILSHLSCSEEIMDLDDKKETEYVKEQIAKHSNSGLRRKARELSEFRAVGKQHTSRFQPKVIDCRHSRRM